MENKNGYRRVLKSLGRLLPAAFWMTWIFSASTDMMSEPHTSRFLEPFLRWLFPGGSQDLISWLHLLIRKGAHLAEYAVLGILLWRACGFFYPGERLSDGCNCADSARNWRKFSIALILSMLYAASDEFHQLFVPSRGASVYDVMIDTTGAALGLLGILVFRLLQSGNRVSPSSSAAISEP